MASVNADKLDVIRRRSDVELVDMWQRRNEFPPDTVAALEAIVNERGIKPALPAPPKSDGQKQVDLLIQQLGKDEYLRRWNSVLGGVRQLPIRSGWSTKDLTFARPPVKWDLEGFAAGGAIVVLFIGVRALFPDAAARFDGFPDPRWAGFLSFFVLRGMSYYFAAGLEPWEGKPFAALGGHLYIFYRSIKSEDIIANGHFCWPVFWRTALLMMANTAIIAGAVWFRPA